MKEKLKFMLLLTVGAYIFGYFSSLLDSSSNISFLIFVDVALVGLIIMIIGLNKGVAYGSNKNNP